MKSISGINNFTRLPIFVRYIVGNLRSYGWGLLVINLNLISQVIVITESECRKDRTYNYFSAYLMLDKDAIISNYLISFLQLYQMCWWIPSLQRRIMAIACGNSVNPIIHFLLLRNLSDKRNPFKKHLPRLNFLPKECANFYKTVCGKKWVTKKTWIE